MTSETVFSEMRAEMADKVRKLLAQAEDPAATVHEAATFTAKAQQLMTKYSIDLAMVVDGRRRDEVEVKTWRVNGPYSAHKLDMAFAAARANDCRAIFARLEGGASQISVVGFPHDIDWIQTLFASLELQLAVALSHAAADKPDHVHGRTFAVGFVKGFVDEVGERLAQARRQAVAEARRAEEAGAAAEGRSPQRGTSVALVLAEKDKQVDDEFKVHFPHVRTLHRYVRLSSWSGYQPGRDAGSRAQLARGSVAGRRSLPA